MHQRHGTIVDLIGKVRHSGDVSAKVIEGTYRVLKQAEKTLAAPADWSMLNLNADERMIFAESAHVIRFGGNEREAATPIKPQQLIIPRRHDDRASDLWTIFNVAQENDIRGGLRVCNWTNTAGGCAASQPVPSTASIRISSSTKPCGCLPKRWLD